MMMMMMMMMMMIDQMSMWQIEQHQRVSFSPYFFNRFFCASSAHCRFSASTLLSSIPRTFNTFSLWSPRSWSSRTVRPHHQVEQLSNSNMLISPWNGWESRWQWLNGTCLKPPTKQGCGKQCTEAGPRHSDSRCATDPPGEVPRDLFASPHLREPHRCHRLELQPTEVSSSGSSSSAFLVGLMLPNFTSNRKVSS